MHVSNEVNKFKVPQLILELNKRNLNSVGKVVELKNRLLWYLNGESCSNDFETLSDNCHYLNNQTKKVQWIVKHPILNLIYSLVHHPRA